MTRHFLANFSADQVQICDIQPVSRLVILGSMWIGNSPDRGAQMLAVVAHACPLLANKVEAVSMRQT